MFQSLVVKNVAANPAIPPKYENITANSVHFVRAVAASLPIPYNAQAGKHAKRTTANGGQIKFAGIFPAFSRRIVIEIPISSCARPTHRDT